MNKIYVVDAVNFLFRSYYGIGPMTNKEGQSTSALYGFIRSVQKLIRDFSIDHLVAVFDGPDNKKSRRAVYAEYKMHRKGAPEDLFPQFDWAYEYCERAGIPTLCVEGVEADDAMAAVAVWAEKQGANAYLCSSDKDLAQLVSPHIFMIHPHKENLLIDEAKVKEIFGVRPNQILDYLAIVGDASDNIPGMEGFGPKTAASLLEEFGTLDNILAHPEKVKGEKKQETIRSQKQVALMSRELATLDVKVPVPQEAEFYRITATDKQKLYDFFHRMNFQSLLREIGSEPPPKKVGKRQTDQRHYHLVEDPKELFATLAKEKEVCIDTETTDLSPMKAELVGIGFSVEPGTAWYVPYRKEILPDLLHFFYNADCSFYGHNIKYDSHVLENLGIHLKKISFDTLIASYLLNPQTRVHNLDALCLDKFQKVKIPIEQLIGKGKNQISMRDVPLDQIKEYCCEDADYTVRLKELFTEELEERKLLHILKEIELPLLSILAQMERTGIFLDAAKLRTQGSEIVKEIEELKRKIFQLSGEEFNLNSPKQLSQILFQKLGLKQPARKKTEFSTSADVLEDLSEEHEIARLLLEYRALEKLRSTYIEALPESIHPETGRIHCTFNQSVAATGRLSCQDPNLQNIPVKTKEGNAIRSCFRPQKIGWSFIGGDYSQIELRLLAHFSEDPELVKAFRSNRDIHTYTASLVFGVPEAEVTPEMRNGAKTVNFGILYGQGPFGLSQQLRISMREASEFIKTYFERYPRVQDYLESCKEEARKKGVSKTLTGRERPIPELHNKNPAIRAAAERLAINTPLQGTAADLIKLAMIQIDKTLTEKHLEGNMILQIHDELIFEVPGDEVSLFQQLVKEKMENVFQLNVPIVVHIAVGKNWAEC
jgi:DNA polymerase-1